jgi:hypothetical protein
MTSPTPKPITPPAEKQPEQLLTTPLSHANQIKPPNWTAQDVLRHLGYTA